MNFIVLNRKRNKFDMAQFSATQRAFMVKKYYETKSYDQVQRAHVCVQKEGAHIEGFL